ncbi:MAG: FKBP-type peptidyl-prolyl cis-trans isomerase [Rikenellaceae bacterium]|jgi:FKBP-type peptidyl-prolyl cis-trans isomerase|nr:FKBP-type peptidyl-prolyl cis-trans isomerase [Rikenellaceae bacterium]
MKKLLIVAVIFSAALVSCQSNKSIKSFTQIDSVSYAIGTFYGDNTKRLDSTMNVAVIAQAIGDVIANKPQMTQEQANDYLNNYFMVVVPARNKAEAIAYLAEIEAKNPNVKKTESGLLYEIIDEGDMSVRATNDADQVKVNYRGTLKNGTEFDKNDSISFALNRVIPGWTEGMKLVGKGGHIILWVPAELGYGEGARGPIPANAALKFEVDLLDVIPATPAE